MDEVAAGSWAARLEGSIAAKRSALCIGLDPELARMPISNVYDFNVRIIEATIDLVAAYKLQLAFYEALGAAGIRALERTIICIRDRDADVIVIGDGKRGDIGSTAAAYARAMFETWAFDAATVNVYQGKDAVEPFLEYDGRGVFVVCRTSNPSSGSIQDLAVPDEGRTVPLHMHIAACAQQWGMARENVGLVVGATVPAKIAELRSLYPMMPLLIPGIGAQGGDPSLVVRVGLSGEKRRVLLSSSRAIIYASRDPQGFGDAARQAALRTRTELALA